MGKNKWRLSKKSDRLIEIFRELINTRNERDMWTSDELLKGVNSRLPPSRRINPKQLSKFLKVTQRNYMVFSTNIQFNRRLFIFIEKPKSIKREGYY